eukprot:6022300-Prymnesium_polylepis.1
MPRGRAADAAAHDARQAAVAHPVQSRCGPRPSCSVRRRLRCWAHVKERGKSATPLCRDAPQPCR